MLGQVSRIHTLSSEYESEGENVRVRLYPAAAVRISLLLAMCARGMGGRIWFGSFAEAPLLHLPGTFANDGFDVYI